MLMAHLAVIALPRAQAQSLSRPVGLKPSQVLSKAEIAWKTMSTDIVLASSSSMPFSFKTKSCLIGFKWLVHLGHVALSEGGPILHGSAPSAPQPAARAPPEGSGLHFAVRARRTPL